MDNHEPLTVDLIVPALNEQDNIPVLLSKLPAERLRHVIIVDNGSTDQTAQAARSGGAVVVQESRRGYGAACLAGLAWIAGNDNPPDAVAFIDADLADDNTALLKLCGLIGHRNMDLVIGSRIALAQPGALTGPQRVGNQIACRMLRLLTGVRYTDLGPMRVIRWSSLQRLNMSDRTWGWTVEMQFKAAVAPLRVLEVPVVYRARHAGKSKVSGSLTVSVRAGWKILTTILWLWLQHHTARRMPAAKPIPATTGQTDHRAG